ncbi:MAG: phosphoethanolamine--lipid A transferase EptA [Nitrosomonadales bacterium]|nr:phosphoethanolamine--lipid A transferase EptA [Nitrosomonadales bacterium]
MAPINGWRHSFDTASSWLLKVAKAIGEKSYTDINTINFITVFALGNAIFYHRLLFLFAVNTLDYLSLNGILTLLTLFVLVVFVSSLFLAIIALVTQCLVKPVCMLIVCGNAVALYFAETYHVILDRTMMGNVFNSNLQEAAELFHPKLLIYIFVYAVLPCFLLSRLNIQKVKFYKRFIYLFIVLFLGLGWSFANAKTWLWIDKNGSKLGGMIMPWSYVGNSIRWYHGNYFRASRQVTLLPAAHFIGSGKAIVILVIGESARAQNFSLYGYPRPTNPMLAKAAVVALPETTACSTYTTASIECMLSHLGSNTSLMTLYEPLPSYMQRSGVNVIWRSDNWGEPILKINHYQRAEVLRKTCQEENCNYDEVLLHDLNQDLQNSTEDKTFVVLHQHGSHGPSYFKNYPGKFMAFKPVCSSVDLQKCTNEELVNAYDNTVLYTDHFLYRVIELLKTFQQPTVMLHVSDHGESLGEFGLYLHGAPYSIAPDVQKKVPFIVWMSDEFKKQKGIDNNDIGKGANYSQDNVFHSVMGAFGMRSDIYNKQLDIFNID